ncbi:MAG: BatA domain-containing protein, partial [Deltaproteobacteria bacterium]|nr:BatA domain-containing protein [Deltaproteobacteria bacterium]
MYRFAYPYLLFLLVFIAVGVFFAYRRKPSAITFSGASELRSLVGKGSFLLVKIPLILRIIALVLLVVAAARPQKYNVSS